MTDEELSKLTFNEIFSKQHIEKLDSIVETSEVRLSIGQKIFETILCLLIIVCSIPFMLLVMNKTQLIAIAIGFIVIGKTLIDLDTKMNNIQIYHDVQQCLSANF
jgi:hypothetical protein